VRSEKKLIIFLLFVIFVAALVHFFGVNLYMKNEPRKSGSLNGMAMNDLPAPDGLPMFIMFFTQDCSICQSMEPSIKKFEKEFEGKIRFLMIDANDPASMRLNQDFQIDGVPAFYWLTADRKVFDAKVGGWPIAAIRKNMVDLIKQNESK